LREGQRQGWLLSSKHFLARETLRMPNDAKFGLIVGVAVVIAIAVVFFRKEPGPSEPGAGKATAAAVGANNLPAPPSHKMTR